MDVTDFVKEYLEMYRSVGISTVPMVFKEKKPRVEWKRYQYKLPTLDELNSDDWFGRFDRNIAIICGHISDLVILDFDSAESYKVCMTKELEKRFLIAATHAKRRHVYIRTKGTIESKKYLPLNFEIKSNGAYCIVPPSLHPSGNNYHFQMGFEDVKKYFTEGEYIEEDELIELIEDFRTKLVEYYDKKKGETSEVIKGEEKSVIPTGYPCYEGVLKTGAEKGSRDEVAIRIASFLKKRRIKHDKIVEEMLTWNEKNYELVNGEKVPCPLTSKEILDKIKSADKGYEYSCDKLRELDCFAKYCDEDVCRLKRRKETSDFKQKITELTEKVVKYPGKKVYYDVVLGDKVYTVSNEEMVNSANFSKWYLANFSVCFTRITKANWDAIVCEWMDMAEVSDEENVSDEDLISDNILAKLREYEFMDKISDCLKDNTLFRSNGGVLVHNKAINNLLIKERKVFGIKLDLRGLTILMNEYLNGVTAIRKVGTQSYRFWCFKPELFDIDEGKEDNDL